ncbi:MAG: biopolymer transporter ExbD, partial [Myxococcota bacterium]
APWLKDHKALKGGTGRRMGAADLLLTPLIDMFVILVVFLIMNFSSTGDLPIAAGITLPKASITLQREEAVPIDISEESVTVQGHKVGDTEDILADPDLRIPDLTDKLQDLRKVSETLNPGKPFKGDLIINSHKDVDFKLIRKVMFAAADAGYTNVNFAVLQTGEEGEGETEGGEAAE